ncbi:hypothetical protein UFOVP286_65 [uncultured Caudovirales phage]|uniref:Uncharacterized protein n=1 Tax=uncultured Caudovirales phage TaxID=2100421 RepID=A0A6J5LN16_9CAUD|nr:hypothetical protein UFOVP286_65 [uncultured Caudovirales phage]
MTNFITYRDLTIDLDSIKSFCLGTIDYDDRARANDSNGIECRWGLSQRNDNQILFNLGEIKWSFENNVEAKKAFDFLQEAVKAQNLEMQIKELKDENLIVDYMDKRIKELDKLREDLKAQYNDLLSNKDECKNTR